MASLNDMFKFPMLLLMSSGFAWFSIKYFPSYMLLVFLFAAIVVDLITGLVKAWNYGRVTTSTGFRKTVTKVLIYSCTVVALMILLNMVAFISKSENVNYATFLDALVGFLVFIEVYSIFENMSEAYPDSFLTKYFFGPVIKVLKGRLKNNPINQLGEGDDQHNEKPTP